MCVVGIDLGTTNSLVAVFEEGQVTLIKNRLDDVLTPSVVALIDAAVCVGETAKEKQVTQASNTASAFKRFMGTDKKYTMGKTIMGPIELSALVLKSLIEDAELYLQKPVGEAVISVPAYFNDKQRNATLQAARLAGINVKRLINEPTAAALAYHMHDKKDETVVAVVDLGGGTFDVSILDIFDSVIEVRAIAGDNYLGGEDFDEVIVRHLIQEFELEAGDPSKLSMDLLARLKFAAEQAKKGLSTKEWTSVELQIEGEVYRAELSLDRFENLSEKLLNRLREPLRKAVQDSKFKIHQIDEVILVGGSTRMPIVKKQVAKLFGKLPLCYLNPDEVVVRGAAIAAAMITKDIHFKDTVLTDVCPYTLGVNVFKDAYMGTEMYAFDPIIERNQTIPISRLMHYTNCADYQTAIAVNVYQGESIDVANNLHLGMIEVSIPPQKMGTVRIDVRFTYDVNGVLEVEVFIPSTNETRRAILLNNGNLSELEIQERLKTIEHLKIHPKAIEEHMYLIAKAERLFEMALGQTRQVIGQEIMRFNAVLNSQDRDHIRHGVKRIKDFITFIEEQV